MTTTEAPNFDVRVNGTLISAGVRALIRRVEYESIDGSADLFRLTCADPLDDQGRRQVSTKKLFLPGNEISLSCGYGEDVLQHVGRAQIRKVRPIFPQNAVPTIEVIGYTNDCLMMDNAPEPLQEKKRSGGFKNSKAGRRFTNSTYADVVRLKAEDYKFAVDVDDTRDAPSDFIQKAGMTDYAFVKGLSNLTGFYFWVDYDNTAGRWTLHFRDPENFVPEEQTKEFNFKWAQGDFSTLLTFEPELALQGANVKLIVKAKDPLTGKIFEAKIEEKGDDPPNITSSTANGSERIQEQNENGGIAAGVSNVKIFTKEFSFDVVANRFLRTDAEVAQWALQWFRRNRENFILSKGRVIGVESLLARQVHQLSGLGPPYDGRYNFTRVRHIVDPGSGYTCEISARKVLGKSEPTLSVGASVEGEF